MLPIFKMEFHIFFFEVLEHFIHSGNENLYQKSDYLIDNVLWCKKSLDSEGAGFN